MSYNNLRKGRFSSANQLYFVTVVVRERRAIFSDLYCARILVAILRELENEGLVSWLSWVVMPDHFHGLIQLKSGDISTVMKLLKGRSASRLNQHLSLAGAFWQPSFFDRALRREEDVKAIARYIVANPLRAGLVEDIGLYSHWDAIWL